MKKRIKQILWWTLTFIVAVACLALTTLFIWSTYVAGDVAITFDSMPWTFILLIVAFVLMVLSMVSIVLTILAIWFMVNYFCNNLRR